LLLLLAAPSGVQGQTLFVGLGPTYSIPQGRLADSNVASFGGSVLLGSRKYCQLWTGLRLSYTAYQRRTDTTLGYYENAITLSPEARYFFVQPIDFPLYVHGMLSFSGISGTDSASRTGLGAGLGLGYLLFYDSNCSNWFLDLHANYQAPNLILRAASRPSLPAIAVGLSLNLRL
jgi:hypothetical protein